MMSLRRSLSSSCSSALTASARLNMRGEEAQRVAYWPAPVRREGEGREGRDRIGGTTNKITDVSGLGKNVHMRRNQEREGAN